MRKSCYCEDFNATRRRNEMETLSALLVLCEEILPVNSDFPS